MASDTLLATLAGGAISLATSMATTYWAEIIKVRRESRNIALAFHGGISAILTIVGERRYVQLVRAVVAAGRNGQDIAPLRIIAQRNYVELYSKNVDKLGMLDPALSERIPIFYTCVNSLLEDVDAMADGKWDHLDRHSLLANLEQFADLLGKTISLGNHILSLTQEKYPRSMLWAAIPG